MRLSIWYELLMIIIVFILAWLGFSYFSFDMAKEDLVISVEQEEKIADPVVSNLLERFEPVENTKADSAINVISGRLLANLDSTQYSYSFYVVKNKQVNAFATLGGNIFIFSGLIKNTKNPEELAAVLAHEIGHVQNRDVIHKIAKDFGLQVLTSVLSGGEPSVIAEINKHILSSSYDRQQEQEADQFAFRLLEKSNIKPAHFGSFMLHMKRKKNITMGEHLEVIASHPDSESRIHAALRYDLPAGFEEKPYALDWKAIKSAIR